MSKRLPYVNPPETGLNHKKVACAGPWQTQGSELACMGCGAVASGSLANIDAAEAEWAAAKRVSA